MAFGQRDELVDQLVGGETSAVCLEVQPYAMPEDRFGDLLDILDRYQRVAAEGGSCLGRQNQSLAGTRSGPPADVLLDQLDRKSVV